MKNNPVKTALLISLAVSAIQLPLASHALSTDSEQPMKIAADRVDIDDDKGTSTFKGNVLITRGSIRIEGDSIVVYRDNEKNLDKMHSTGRPAHFEQTPDNKKKPVIAEANELFYDAVKELLIMRGNAKIIQSGNTFTGNSIIYDSKRDKITAKRDPKASTSSGKDGGRIQITIQPKQKGKPATKK